MSIKPEISVVVPCLNEEEAILLCLNEIEETIKKYNLNTEIIVVDNGSSDGSLAILQKKSSEIPYLRILVELERGYGAAYLKGLSGAQGVYIFMADADFSYEFSDIPRFIDKLKEGNDLVVGNRFMGKIGKNSMPWHHKYIGNPLLSHIFKLLFKVKINDIHCGARAINRNFLNKIKLHTKGMEFASEMIIAASQKKLRLAEIPVRYRERKGESKLQSTRDGWRHLRLMLLYSPFYLFLIPGVIMFLTGFVTLFILYFSSPRLFDIQFFVHPMFFSSLLVITGYQMIFFLGFSRVYAINHLGEENAQWERLFKSITIEKVGFAGIFISLIGISIYIYIFYTWIRTGFGSLNEIKNSIVALTFLVLGMQTFFSSFMLSILSIRDK
ncbi:MAG TPA: glycosyltransferase family 2 protein [Candidatus Paceibacterota bacterium]|nr:glycosyltransferase family 2 protein [Candidatus Paceibacterota bacterium]